MKKPLTLLAAIACSITTYAQHVQKATNPLNGKSQKTIAAGGSQDKVTSADSRIIAAVYLEYGTSSFEVQDSTIGKYTGNNGWDYATEGWKFDSTFTWSFDAGSSQWEENGRSYVQLANDRIMSSLHQEWTGSAWEDQQSTTYTYTNGLIATEEFGYNSGSGIEPTSRLTNTYNGDMQITENLQESWNSTTSQFVNSSKTINHYNSSKLNDTTWSYSWIQMTSQWKENMRNIYTYTNGLLTMTLQQTHNGTTWQDAYRNTTTYNAQGNPIMTESENWNVGTSSWDKSFRSEKAYDNNGNLTEEKSAYWNNGAYEYSNKTTYTYNQHNRVLTEETQSWDAVNNQWHYETGSDELWRYYYEPYTNSVKSIASNAAQMNVYPVPAKEIITISASFKKMQPVSVKLMDMTGKVVKSFSDQAGGQYRKTINVSDLPAGRYIIQLSGTNEQATKTFTVTH